MINLAGSNGILERGRERIWQHATTGLGHRNRQGTNRAAQGLQSRGGSANG